MTRNGRGVLAFKLVLLIGVLVAIVWAGTKLDWRAVGREIGTASLPAMLGMAIAWVAALFIRPMRLLLLLRALTEGSARSYWNVWAADILAMATNSILPMRAGDMMMAFVLRQHRDERTASVFSVVMVDRLFDLALVIVMFVATLSFAPTVAPWATDLQVSLVVALVGLAVLGWFAIRMRDVVLNWVRRALTRGGEDQASRWLDRVRDLFAGLAVVDRPVVLAPVVLLSIALWAATTLSYWFAIHAIWPSISLAGAAYAAAAVALSFVVPLTPGGLGVFHAAAVLALSLFGVPAEPALAFAIVMHAFQLGSVLMLAVVALLCQGISVRALAFVRNSAS